VPTLCASGGVQRNGAYLSDEMEIMMIKRVFALVALTCLSALSFASSLVDRVVDAAFSLLPNMISAKPAFTLDNGHPRSPLASVRAGVA